ncbi:TadG family pilus assembly protein [Trinickia symbiotica]|uniref:TadG family pilus assembly protein n=1 Tax=Trinickia symbiotica TaxID=863227 RepID=UPI0015E7DD73|nr:TadG family pilus assembly protein [Trinickia symbiotica]
MVVLVALMLATLLAFAALAIDIAHLFVVRNELQNAADAAALAGVGCVYQRSECGNLTAQAPDWNTSFQEATSAISLNKSDGVTLTTATVDYGYWNLTGTPSGLQPLPYTPGTGDLPAVRVTVNRASGKNSGPVSLLFGNFVGMSSAPVSAEAVAVVSSPGYVGPGGLFPVAINQCMYRAMLGFWNSSTNRPALAASASPLNMDGDQTLQQTPGTPYKFQINSTYHDSSGTGCNTGQWTSLDSGGQVGASTIRDYVNKTESSPAVSIGSQIFIENGTVSSNLQAVDSCSALDGNQSCAYELFPVINEQPINPGASTAVVAFACLKIDSANWQGSSKYIVVELASNPDMCQGMGSSGIGPAYGALTPPRLVQ